MSERPDDVINASEPPKEATGMRQSITDGIAVMPPSATVINSLEGILKGQFGEIDENIDAPPTIATQLTIPIAAASTSSAGFSGRATEASPKQIMGSEAPADRPSVGGQLENELGHTKSSIWAQLCENRFFTVFFMTLTFYALFVPDLDLLLGSADSKFIFSIITSAVVILFLFETGVQSLGRKKYFGRAYFWLDVVALISLVPDTWFVQSLLYEGSNAFVAGRSSRLTKLIRIASRSSKATRLNRLTRIVRVASLMPRLGAFLGHRVKGDDTEKLLEKKLRRVFVFLDEDMDGQIPRSAVYSCMAKMREETQEKDSKGKLIWKAGQAVNAFITGSGSGTRKAITAGEKGPQDEDAGANSLTRVPSAQSQDEGGSEASGNRVVPLPAQLGHGASASSSDTQASLARVESSASSSKATREGGVRNMFGRGPFAKPGKGKTGSGENPFASDDDDLLRPEDEPASELVTFEVFRKEMLADEDIATKLRKSCQQQLRQGNNMKNITSRHSEYIAVKVALGVLVLLFVLGWVEPDVQDLSAERGLTHITNLVKLKYVTQTSVNQIPMLIHGQVSVWVNGVGVDPEKRKVLYLDLDKKVYCDEFLGGICSHPVWNSTWGTRTSFTYIEAAVKNSHYRRSDMMPIRVPDLSSETDISDEELHRKTDSVAVLNIRASVQTEAVMSIMTTILVIIIILSGITLLTKDLTYLSRNLLKPLRELADDMESIAQLQLAGVSQEAETIIEEGTSEVRLIRRTFENMKKGIKSWGKYVPWPVVQLLLRANVEANLEVNEVEVTIYFSDIQSFTTIVESMPPESSLLLLSRYFNDMSKVIDDHGGVVLEFIGDAILCIYGAPLINPEHPSAASKSALRMLTSLRRMNEWSAARELPEVKIRCGVHTGRVLVGNMGFHSRMKYGIVGEDAHIPSRLEEINKTYGTSMMISHATWQRLDTESNFITRPCDFVNLRQTPGAPSELIYQVIDRERKGNKSSRYWQPAGLHTEAMQLYRTSRFKLAAEKFATVGQMMEAITGSEDEASKLMVKRCETYMEQPPPHDWDGVWKEP